MYELLTGLGLALPAGLNAYIPLLAIAIADRYFGLVNLSEPYDVISSPLGIAIISILLIVEVLADKIPLVDHANDLLNSVVRPAAGAILLMASTSTVDSVNPVFAMILGLLVAGSVHSVKATVRPTVTATTAGVGNPVISTLEDGAAITLAIIAIVAPILVALIFIALAVATVIILRRWRARRARLAAPPEP